MAKGQRAKGQKGKRARVQVQKFASMWTKKKGSKNKEGQETLHLTTTQAQREAESFARDDEAATAQIHQWQKEKILQHNSWTISDSCLYMTRILHFATQAVCSESSSCLRLQGNKPTLLGET